VAEESLDALVRDLAALGRAVDRPTSPDRLATAVLGRVATLPAPGEAGSWWTRVRSRVTDGLAGVASRRRVALVVAVVLAALLATPPVRATIAAWFGFGGVVVERGPSGQGPASPPPVVPSGRAVQEAAAEVGFPVWVPVGLGEPDGVEVSVDRRVVSMGWSRGDAGVVRLDQFDGRLDFAFLKRAPEVRYTPVGGSDALWFEEPHEVVLLDADGTRRTESARLAGHTLIWQRGPTTLRLEAEVDLERAVEIAESAVPVR
jgi:hypothetical protein